ncbi:hypothetical protein ACI797_17750 [Geodermatophilus sp. SYSU D00691]
MEFDILISDDEAGRQLAENTINAVRRFHEGLGHVTFTGSGASPEVTARSLSDSPPTVASAVGVRALFMGAQQLPWLTVEKFNVESRPADQPEG